MTTVLRAKREAMGVSLREMARRINISAPYLSDIERENRSAPPETQRAICEAYGIESHVAFWPVARWAYVARKDYSGPTGVAAQTTERVD